jgi:FtsH-binding integral membrane protein
MAFETDRAPDGRGYAASRGWVGTAAAADIDLGLRKYLLGVYNYMASGLLLSGIVALTVANTGLARVFYRLNEDGRLVGYTGLGLVAMLAPIGMIFFMNANRQISTLKVLYWAFVALMGVGLTVPMLAYTGVSVARTFFITAIAFGGLSLYGYSTKRDLSGFRTFLIMGLIGIIVASVVNLFLHSTMVTFVVSIIGVLVFAGLTAYDTQNLKRTYYGVSGTGVEEHSAIMGATQLYLDFVNLFLFLLRFIGDRR